jgi:hypothetical protein
MRDREYVEWNCKSRRAVPSEYKISSWPNIVIFSVHDQPRGEEKILVKIIRLDIQKIQKYLKDLRAVKGVFEELISAVESRLSRASLDTTPSGHQQFLEWLGHISAVRDLPPHPEPEVLVDHIRWAQKPRYNMLNF